MAEFSSDSGMCHLPDGPPCRKMSGKVGKCSEMSGNQNYKNNLFFHDGKFSNFETIFKRFTRQEKSGNAVKHATEGALKCGIAEANILTNKISGVGVRVLV